MRVLGTFMTILILGISSTAIARRQISIEDKPIHSQSKFGDIPHPIGLETSGATDEKFKAQLRRKCEQNGGPTAYDTLKRNLQSFPECLATALNMEQLQHHIAASVLYGKLDSPFKEYCGRVPNVMQCFSKGTSFLKSCLEPKEIEAFEISNNVTNSLLEFLCQDDGHRISLFVTEGGVQCLISNTKVLQTCLTEAFDKRPQLDDQQLSLRFLPGPEECANVEALRICVASAMRTCSNPSPALVMESVFDFYKRERSCKATTEQSTTPAEVDATETWTSSTPRESIPDEDDTLEDYVRRTCETNGGSMAYDNLKESAQLVFDTYGLVANTSQISDELTNAALGDEMVNVFKKYCRRAPILKGLIDFASDSMKQCLGPDERRSLQILQKIRSSMLEFVCHNGGERFSTLIDSGGIDCFGYRGKAFMNCASQIAGGYSPDTFSVGAPALGLEKLEVQHVEGAQFCADLDKFRDCAFEALAQCGDKTTNLNLLNLGVDLINEEIPCRNFVVETETPDPEITSTTTAPEVVSTTEETFGAVSNLKNITLKFSDLYPTMRKVSIKVLEHYLAEKRELNRGPSVYDAGRVMPYYVSKYVQSMVLNLRWFDFEGKRANERDKVDDFFKNFCGQASMIEDHVERLANFSDTFPDSMNPEMMEIVSNTTRAFEEFLCRDEGVHLASFAAAGGIRCWASRKQDIEKCMADYFPPHFPIFNNVCSDHSRGAYMCFAKTLHNCGETTMPVMIDALIDHMIDKVPCRDRLGPEDTVTPTITTCEDIPLTISNENARSLL